MDERHIGGEPGVFPCVCGVKLPLTVCGALPLSAGAYRETDTERQTASGAVTEGLSPALHLWKVPAGV